MRAHAGHGALQEVPAGAGRVDGKVPPAGLGRHGARLYRRSGPGHERLPRSGRARDRAQAVQEVVAYAGQVPPVRIDRAANIDVRQLHIRRLRHAVHGLRRHRDPGPEGVRPALRLCRALRRVRDQQEFLLLHAGQLAGQVGRAPGQADGGDGRACQGQAQKKGEGAGW